MSANTNETTGIRYGIIAANNLNPYVIDEIQTRGKDVHYEDAKESLWSEVKAVCRDYMLDSAADEIADLAVENLNFYWCEDEPVHEFEIDGVKGRTTWLGGALMVWVFESPFEGFFNLCSPCVPNCGDLDSVIELGGGHHCYDVPDDWREKE
jgi:hypothetical protein